MEYSRDAISSGAEAIKQVFLQVETNDWSILDGKPVCKDCIKDVSD